MPHERRVTLSARPAFSHQRQREGVPARGARRATDRRAAAKGQ